jgi:PiT family inorganic phosphate transporter
MFIALDILVAFLGVLAAWRMGYHYSEAVMGIAFGSKSIGIPAGVVISGIFVLFGSMATSVVSTYLSLARIGGVYAASVLGVFVIMTNATTYLKIPTSPIQLYAFSLIGSAIAIGAQIDYHLLTLLIVSWAVAPLLSFLLACRVYRITPSSQLLRFVIIATMIYSAFVLGLNDVSNAASSLILYGFGIAFSKAICGVSIFIGMLTWRARLIKRVGMDRMELDYGKAWAAQLTRSGIISVLNAFGVNASLHQTTVSALASLGARRNVLRPIIESWIYSPLIGLASSYLISLLINSWIY